ncbi:MAG: prepilin peptidase [Phycisphaerae bacterium]|nr:prepilin peptidase [Phycisphaerae bacterium]
MIPLQWFWLIAVALFAACIGSFLNVVIYRLARGMSVSRPTRSFCPGCRQTIAWYDNLPIISYLLLRGRCRRCGMAISVQYPLVEGLTVLVFVLAYDTFFLGPARLEFVSMQADWAIFLAHLVLLAALIITSAIDIEGYWIDVTITYTVIAVGVVAHGLWTPASAEAFPWPWPATAAAATAAALGLILSAIFWPREPLGAEDDAEQQPEPEPTRPPKRKDRSGPRIVFAWLMALAIFAWFALLLIDADRLDDVTSFAVRAGLILLTCFGVLVGVGMAPTEAEADIVEAIHEERDQARREAVIELAWLLPAIVLGILAGILVTHVPRAGAGWEQTLAWPPFGGSWRPVLGVTTALAGAIVAGAIGWGVRIVFTLALGKEAFGMGDVHLMAAAGAVAGWGVVAAGFFLACPLAVAAVIIWLLRKRSRAVWFGPWLSLGVLVAMVLYAPIAERAATMLEVLQWAFGGAPK